ncbi:MAG TPA: questin oxidase family protein [Thermoanaerobaculia bacterium]|nr:questin oxidase family protein [Thermoanaerobaculia bacterium]
MTAEVLHELLTNGRAFSASYGGGMSNHFPMALLALERLGADDRRLREFAAFYEKRLRRKAADGPALPGDGWRSALGRSELEVPLAAMLADEVRHAGAEAVLRDVLPALTPGIGAAAFHGVIRTAYAVDSGDDADVPDALTSWIIAYDDLRGEGSEALRFTKAAEAFDAMHGDDRFPKDLKGASISGRIEAIAAMPGFADYRHSIAAVALPDLARIAVAIYLDRADFTALHMVTGCHAARVLAPYLAADALDHLATALLGAYATIGRPAFDVDADVSGSAADWDALAARAILSNDDHDLKFVYSCREEEAVYGWGLHRRAAAMRLER